MKAREIRKTTARCGGRHGFTLVEVLAALVIFSFAYVAILEVISSGLRYTALGVEYDRALMHAQSRMTAVMLEPVLEPGERAGAFSGTPYRWELAIEPFARTDAAGSSSSELVKVQLTVWWKAGMGRRSVRLRTLRARAHWPR